MNDQKEAFRLLIGIIIISTFFLGVIFYFSFEWIPEIINYMNEGVNLRSASIYAFFFTFISFIVLLIFAGDGVMGEFLVTVISFGFYYILSWLWIATIF